MRALLIFSTSIVADVFGSCADTAAPVTIVQGLRLEQAYTERSEALRKTTDVERARKRRGCRGCHKQDASSSGRTYPRLTGIRFGDCQTADRYPRRFAPQSEDEPFISPDAVSVDEIADIAAYLSL